MYFFFFQAEDGIRDKLVTGVQTCALPISHHLGDPVHVPLHEVAAQTVRRAQRALEVHPAAGRILAEQRAARGGVDHVHLKPPFHHARNGQTCAAHGDALTPLQTLVGRADRESEPVLAFPLPPAPARSPVARNDLDPPDGAHNSGKHSRLSNTNNVSGPMARRSTGIQRGASGSGAAGTPGNAGTAPSPSHTGAWIQYSRSTSPSASSLAPSAPPPSHNTEWIPAPRS